MLLAVRAGGSWWLADVGFGADGLVEPVPLEDGATSQQGAWTFRVAREDGSWSWALQSRQADGWLDLYGFTLEPQHPIDYVMANHFTSTHPLSAFTRVATAQRTGPDRRLVLRGRLLRETAHDGVVDEREVGAAELDEVLRERFGIVLADDELRTLRARWPGQPAG